MDDRPPPFSASLAVVVGGQSQELRRRLGPLAWCALETMALGAEREGDNWLSVGGLRALAQQMGVTKDTAGRAVAPLLGEGLLARVRLDDPDPARLSGYLLRLPPGVELWRSGKAETPGCPHEQDTRRACPGPQDSVGCPGMVDTTLPKSLETAADRPRNGPKPRERGSQAPQSTASPAGSSTPTRLAVEPPQRQMEPLQASRRLQEAGSAGGEPGMTLRAGCSTTKGSGNETGNGTGPEPRQTTSSCRPPRSKGPTRWGQDGPLLSTPDALPCRLDFVTACRGFAKWRARAGERSGSKLRSSPNEQGFEPSEKRSGHDQRVPGEDFGSALAVRVLCNQRRASGGLPPAPR